MKIKTIGKSINLHKRKIKIFFIIVLVLVASFFRLYRISERTEFLGDQGRDGIVIRNLVRSNTLPQIGPSLSNGQFTGPFYYYLIAPLFIFSGFNPIIPPIQMAIMGIITVGILFLLTTSLFGFSIGYGIGMLYAISPGMVFQDMRLWNPTPIPLFALLVLFSLNLIVKRKYWGIPILFLSDAILFQLHYVNSITIVLSLVFLTYILYRSIKDNSFKRFLLWICIAIITSGAFSLPFFLYESKIGFRDIIGSAGTFTDTSGFIFSKRHYLENIVEMGSNLMKYLVNIPWKIPLFLLSLCIMILSLFARTMLSYILVVWMGISLLVMAFYKDVINVQYLYQLIPVTFLLVGNVLGYLKIRFPFAVFLVIVSLCIGMICQTDIFKEGHNDIVKTKMLSKTVMALSVNKPFAFTTFSSRSFTDLHYRFFMDLENIIPEKIDDDGYSQLFVVCDAGECPTAQQLLAQNKIYAVCSEIVCKLDNPIIDMSKWEKRDEERVGSSMVYGFVRKQI